VRCLGGPKGGRDEFIKDYELLLGELDRTPDLADRLTTERRREVLAGTDPQFRGRQMVSPIGAGGIYMLGGKLMAQRQWPCGAAAGRAQHVNDTTDRHDRHKAN